MRKKIIAMLATIVFLAVVYTQPVIAQGGTVEVYAWTDKRQYQSGEKGTLYITVRNGLPGAITIEFINITYPWHGYLGEDEKGFESIEVNTALSSGSIYSHETSFDVPDDGRLLWTQELEIVVETTEEGNFSPPNERTPSINVAAPPAHSLLMDLDKWMTTLTTAIVICTIILAAVVFLSTRRPTIAAVAPRTKA